MCVDWWAPSKLHFVSAGRVHVGLPGILVGSSGLHAGICNYLTSSRASCWSQHLTMLRASARAVLTQRVSTRRTSIRPRGSDVGQDMAMVTCHIVMKRRIAQMCSNLDCTNVKTRLHGTLIRTWQHGHVAGFLARVCIPTTGNPPTQQPAVGTAVCVHVCASSPRFLLMSFRACSCLIKTRLHQCGKERCVGTHSDPSMMLERDRTGLPESG